MVQLLHPNLHQNPIYTIVQYKNIIDRYITNKYIRFTAFKFSHVICPGSGAGCILEGNDHSNVRDKDIVQGSREYSILTVTALNGDCLRISGEYPAT